MPTQTEDLPAGHQLTREVDTGIQMDHGRGRKRERIVLFPGTPAETVVLETGLICRPDGGRAFVYQGSTGLSHSEAQELRRKAQGIKAPVLTEKDIRRIADERAARRSEGRSEGVRGERETPEDELSRLLRAATSPEMKRAIIAEWQRANGVTAAATSASPGGELKGFDLRAFVEELGAAWEMLGSKQIEKPAYEEMKAKLIGGLRPGCEASAVGAQIVLAGLVASRVLTKAEMQTVLDTLTVAPVGDSSAA